MPQAKKFGSLGSMLSVLVVVDVAAADATVNDTAEPLTVPSTSQSAELLRPLAIGPSQVTTMVPVFAPEVIFTWAWKVAELSAGGVRSRTTGNGDAGGELGLPWLSTDMTHNCFRPSGARVLTLQLAVVPAAVTWQ